MILISHRAFNQTLTAHFLESHRWACCTVASTQQDLERVRNIIYLLASTAESHPKPQAKPHELRTVPYFSASSGLHAICWDAHPTGSGTESLKSTHMIDMRLCVDQVLKRLTEGAGKMRKKQRDAHR
ncbi:hypothetical protein SNOG_01090 [Parastagonospora nodorum SN15]|uniref:Uncharacterized protein n=1 Tax=Phaeosphaeria nodorum (strain SN15 / ATCC MYA-4574 / FGSC 10173) TaxID=321614 RepID=Q0V4H4_PHANO|nr:hypothetical protein SNOG_01090 [Parastagonospora nodorum SN15]EAT92585.1 hypothetical protein SNOG_01090 [Parastagonospora nodorum SN15]